MKNIYLDIMGSILSNIVETETKWKEMFDECKSFDDPIDSKCLTDRVKIGNVPIFDIKEYKK